MEEKTEKEKAQAIRDAKKARQKRKGAGPLSGLLAILAFICLVYGIVVVFMLGTGEWFNFIWIIGAVVLIVLSFLFSRHSGIPTVIKIVLGIVILVCIAHFGYHEFKTVSAASGQPAQNPRWIVVLGAKVNGTSPSLEYQKRLEKAASFISSANLASQASGQTYNYNIITTGGQGNNEGAAEGDVGARVLKLLGVTEDRILIDNKSTSTQENIQFAKDLITANGGTVYDPVMIVTSSFHLYRASRLAWACGFENVSGLGSTGLAVLVPHYYAREYAAYVKEFTMGHFSR